MRKHCEVVSLEEHRQKVKEEGRELPRKKPKLGPKITRIGTLFADEYNDIGKERRALNEVRRRLKAEWDTLMEEDNRLATMQRKWFEKKEWADHKSETGFVRWNREQMFIPY